MFGYRFLWWNAGRVCAKESNFHRKSTTLKIIVSKYYNPITLPLSLTLLLSLANTKNLCDAWIVCTHFLVIFSYTNTTRQIRGERVRYTCVHDGYQFVRRCDFDVYHHIISFHYVFTCYTHFRLFYAHIVMPLLFSMFASVCVYTSVIASSKLVECEVEQVEQRQQIHFYHSVRHKSLCHLLHYSYLYSA